MYNSPENLRIGGGVSETTLTPAVAIIMLAAIVAVLLLPRKHAIVPFLLASVLTPFGQEVYAAGVHIFVVRFLVIAGWARLCWTRVSSDEHRIIGLTTLDKLFIAWALCHAVATCLEFMQIQALVNQCGFILDTVGYYLLLRFFIRDEEDCARAVSTCAFMVAFLMVTMTVEKFYQENIFGYLGGRLSPFIREGAVRAQGPFQGPIPAGTFGAALFCLFLWLRKYKGGSAIAVLGMVGSAAMAVLSASSTPLITLATGLLALPLWPLRTEMRLVRWGLVATLAGLQLAMKAPVWMVINHIDLVGGNSGYHRAMLIDTFVRHFSEWWITGTQSTASWGYDMWDGANQFVAEGASGGLLTLILFIGLICYAFSRLGRTRMSSLGNVRREWQIWLLGMALFSQIVSFFGISFADQLQVGWYVLLAIIACVTAPASDGKSEAEHRPIVLGTWKVPEEVSAGLAEA